MTDEEFKKQHDRVQRAASIRTQIESWKSRLESVRRTRQFTTTFFVDQGPKLHTEIGLSIVPGESWVPHDTAKEVFDFAKKSMMNVCDAQISELRKLLDEV